MQRLYGSNMCSRVAVVVFVVIFASNCQALQPETGDVSPWFVDTSGCGETKSCFRDPEDCWGQNCSYLLTWESTGNDLVTFEIQVTLTGTENYVAFGMSTDQRMVCTLY